MSREEECDAVCGVLRQVLSARLCVRGAVRASMTESERVGVGVWETLSVQYLRALHGRAKTRPSKGSSGMKTMS